MSEIEEWFNCKIEYDYEYHHFIDLMYPDATEGSASVMRSRLKTAFMKRKLTPTSRAFLIYLKYNNKFQLEEQREGE